MCQKPKALLPRTSPAHRGLPTPRNKDAWGQSCTHAATESGSKEKAEVRLAINMPEDLKVVPAALHRRNLPGLHPPERTNLGPSSSWTLCPAREDRGQGKPPAPIPWDAHRDDKIPDLKRLKSRQDLRPTVKPQACLSHGDKNKSPLKIE